SHRVVVRRGGHDRDTGGQGVLGTPERRPPISMLSALGASAPEAVRSRELLSAPLAPTRAVTWPRGTSKETSRSTWRVGRVHRRGSGRCASSRRAATAPLVVLDPRTASGTHRPVEGLVDLCERPVARVVVMTLTRRSRAS